VTYVALFSVLYNIPRFFEYEKVEVCVGLNESREAFEMSAFGGNTVYRVVYANVLYFVVMLGGQSSLGDFTFWISQWLRPKTETEH